MLTIVFLVLIAIGLFFNFFGHKYLKKTLVLLGFLFGTGITYLVIDILTTNINIYTIIGILVIGIMSAFGISFFFEIGLFFISFVTSVIGFAFVTRIWENFSFSSEKIISLILVGIIGGIVSLFIRGHILKVFTSILGTILIVLSSSLILGNFQDINITEDYIEIINYLRKNINFLGFASITIFTMGITYQYGLVTKLIELVRKIHSIVNKQKSSYIESNADDIQIEFENVRHKNIQGNLNHRMQNTPQNNIEIETKITRFTMPKYDNNIGEVYKDREVTKSNLQDPYEANNSNSYTTNQLEQPVQKISNIKNRFDFDKTDSNSQSLENRLQKLKFRTKK
ncbi:MAG: TMEM198/TM7SF3 family protein [Candidatus Dojkabacteria bacterium]|nr:TMEM198/TM7SF3 family protein [Candidatus Dojkabacteria bacterium]